MTFPVTDERVLNTFHRHFELLGFPTEHYDKVFPYINSDIFCKSALDKYTTITPNSKTSSFYVDSQVCIIPEVLETDKRFYFTSLSFISIGEQVDFVLINSYLTEFLDEIGISNSKLDVYKLSDDGTVYSVYLDSSKKIVGHLFLSRYLCGFELICEELELALGLDTSIEDLLKKCYWTLDRNGYFPGGGRKGRFFKSVIHKLIEYSQTVDSDHFVSEKRRLLGKKKRFNKLLLLDPNLSKDFLFKKLGLSEKEYQLFEKL